MNLNEQSNEQTNPDDESCRKQSITLNIELTRNQSNQDESQLNKTNLLPIVQQENQLNVNHSDIDDSEMIQINLLPIVQQENQLNVNHSDIGDSEMIKTNVSSIVQQENKLISPNQFNDATQNESNDKNQMEIDPTETTKSVELNEHFPSINHQNVTVDENTDSIHSVDHLITNVPINVDPPPPILKFETEQPIHPFCRFRPDLNWLDPQYDDKFNIRKPNQLEEQMKEPNGKIDQQIFNRICGSMIGMAIGDALGAHVEFRPHQYLIDNPVKDLGSGGTWGLEKGQFTDDTSMALCLANSLIARHGFVLYDQLVRYNWWFQKGFMSSTGHCFDIGAATSQSLRQFQRRQTIFAKENEIPQDQIDYLSDTNLLNKFNVYCSETEVAGNGALMRLTPVPLFFYRKPQIAVEYSGQSGQITHGDVKAYDACRYYGALIVAALHNYQKNDLLDDQFYSKHQKWFQEKKLHGDIQSISEGSYKKDGYKAGIRGKGYIVNALEAALWAFWSTDNFEDGALAAVNLGDDTDTTAAIYGQLAGAFYGVKKLPEKWSKQIYASDLIICISKWIFDQGNKCNLSNEEQKRISEINPSTLSSSIQCQPSTDYYSIIRNPSQICETNNRHVQYRSSHDFPSSSSYEKDRISRETRQFDTQPHEEYQQRERVSNSGYSNEYAYSGMPQSSYNSYRYSSPFSSSATNSRGYSNWNNMTNLATSIPDRYISTSSYLNERRAPVESDYLTTFPLRYPYSNSRRNP